MRKSSHSRTQAPGLWDVGVLAFAACVIFLHSYITRELAYNGASHPEKFLNWSFFVGLPLTIAVALAAIGTLIALVVRITRRSWKDGYIVVVLRCFGLVAIVACYLTTMRAPSRHDSFVGGMRNWVLNNADLEAISAWLSEGGNMNVIGHALPRSEWPSAIADLSPRTVYLTRTEQNGLVVNLVWGGGFGHCGLTVAEDSSLLPPPARRTLYLTIKKNARVWKEHEVD